MSVDNNSDRSRPDTLALIADKLSIVRPEPSESQPELLPEPKDMPSLPAAAQLETLPPSPVGITLISAIPAEPEDAPVPPSIPPAPPPPKIEPFVPVPAVTELKPFAPAPAVLPAVPAKSGVAGFVTTALAIVVALCALGFTAYQGMLFRQGIDLMQRNAARSEYARACPTIIETYFQIKPKVGALMPTPDRGNVAGASRVSEANRLDAQATIARFSGLGTYLANFQDAATRARYNELTNLLTGIYDSARTTPLAEIDRVFAPADKLFNQMNDDCARLSRAAGL